MTDATTAGLVGHALVAQVSVLFQVVMIDLVLAGDNAVAVGMAASHLDRKDRGKVIVTGLAAAVVMRIGFAVITTQLMGLIGLLFAGGLLLLWVCWRMWRDMRRHDEGDAPDIKPAASFRAAFLQILAADLSMSLDNVLAVAGAAREHPLILAAGLLLSIVLMGLAAHAIARLLNRFRWIGYLGLGIVLWVSLHMIWQGHRTLVIDLGRVDQYNAAAPAWADIRPSEIAERRHEKK
ncbi:MAG TPA: TerC family protein [Caulobacteraceae bacterium]|nr:TerC family protein [Caulobacteraceae bacterium]